MTTANPMSKFPELGHSAVPGVNTAHKQALESVLGFLCQNLSDLESGGVKFRVTGEPEYPALDLPHYCDKNTALVVLRQLIEVLS